MFCAFSKISVGCFFGGVWGLTDAVIKCPVISSRVNEEGTEWIGWKSAKEGRGRTDEEEREQSLNFCNLSNHNSMAFYTPQQYKLLPFSGKCHIKPLKEKLWCLSNTGKIKCTLCTKNS